MENIGDRKHTKLIIDRYKKREKGYSRLLKKQEKCINKISTLRLVVFLLALISLIRIYKAGNNILFIIVLIATISLFVYINQYGRIFNNYVELILLLT